jgi:signal transduction histidine kinase
MTAFDFTNSLFVLNGEWEFYCDTFLTPADFADGEPEGKSLVSVPHSWHEDGYPLYGFATYRLILKTNEPELMILIPEIQNSSIVWINGQRVFEAGRPGESASETAPGLRNDFVVVLPEKGQIEIIVQAANFGWQASGLRYGFVIAKPDILLRDALTRRVLVGAVIGVLLAVAFYHAILFVYNRGEWVYFVFSLFCVAASVRLFVDANGFAQFLLPGGMGLGLIYLYMVSMLMYGPLLTLFTHFIFNIPIVKTRLVIYGIFWLLPFAVLLILPYGTIGFQMIYLHMPPLIMAFISVARSKQLTKSPYNILFFSAVVSFLLWHPFCTIVLGNIFYIHAVLTNIFLVLCQCVMLSVSYAENKRRTEELTAKTELLDGLNRTKTEFLQDIKHEVRNPLHIISLSADYIRRRIINGGQTDETLKIADAMQNEAVRLGQMINGMVELAIMSGSAANREKIDFAALLFRCTEIMRLQFAQRKNTLSAEIAPDLPYVYAEAEQLERVLVNLLSNANNAAQNGMITLAASVRDNYITVRVSDNGEGIGPELLPRVFERGVSGKGGKGYGLSICKTIVDAHGGAIEIESEYRKGATVTFSIPVYGGQSEVAEHE